MLGKMKINYFLLFFLTFIFHYTLTSASDPSTNSLNNDDTSLEIFQTLLTHKRAEQIVAVKKIMTLKYEKKYKLLSIMLEKVFKTMTTNKAIVENSDYVLGGFLPKNDTVADALYQLLDNTAMYSEMQLKLPDIMDRIMKQHSEWMVLIKWAIGFSNSTNLFDGNTMKLINLVAQDMSLITKSSDFINPYRLTESMVPKDFEHENPQPKKKKLKNIKGPRISKPSHTELSSILEKITYVACDYI